MYACTFLSLTYRIVFLFLHNGLGLSLDQDICETPNLLHNKVQLYIENTHTYIQYHYDTSINVNRYKTQ